MVEKVMPVIPFSKELESWLKKPGTKTFQSLDKVFAEKSFAVLLIFLLAPSSLPIPTGIITTVFELIAILVAVQMVAGRRSLWLPKRWRDISLNGFAKKKVLPKLVGLIRWFERYSKPRASYLLSSAIGIRVIGLVAIIFSVGSLLSPPFSGLDTLPSLGVVIISLAIILEDIILFLLGLVVGFVGIGLLISLGAAAFKVAENIL